MVFTDDAVGPFTPESVPDAREGYGFEKYTAEQQIRQANPDAVIARLGWQIGAAPGSNNMIDFLAKQDVVRASEKWFPACSFWVIRPLPSNPRPRHPRSLPAGQQHTLELLPDRHGAQ